MAAADTQERRDARAANLAVIHRQPMGIGRNAGPRRTARGAATPLHRGRGTMSHDQGVQRANEAATPSGGYGEGLLDYGEPVGRASHHGAIGENYTNVYGGAGTQDGGFMYGYDMAQGDAYDGAYPGHRAHASGYGDEDLRDYGDRIGRGVRHGVLGQNYTNTYGGRGAQDGGVLHGYDPTGFRDKTGGDVREVQVSGDTDAAGGSESNFYARHESGFRADTRRGVEMGRFTGPSGAQSRLHSGATPRIREYQLNSSDRRSFGAFGTMPDTRGSSMEADRGRLMQWSRSRANAGGIMASRGALFE